VTPVVIDASAGVELVADTSRGRALRTLLPDDAVPWAPETFYVEVGTVLRRWDLNEILTADQIGEALRDLATWPLRVAQVRGLFADAWQHRHNTKGDCLAAIAVGGSAVPGGTVCGRTVHG